MNLYRADDLMMNSNKYEDCAKLCARRSLHTVSSCSKESGKYVIGHLVRQGNKTIIVFYRDIRRFIINSLIRSLKNYFLRLCFPVCL